eukprot:TRINITY_DN22142_c0_g1_i1.p1 TRINITY_DN22142_c0_g1~~TRINITY_DN22142_c0_g1_i1.p1  ORF type:complete len:570 (-),score=127.02 TRINITY_DN22142_c0_g1_i1:274-1983(-)
MIDQVVNFVIRPPRAEYSPDEDLLGPRFNLKGRRFRRHDLELVNARGHVLQCSHYMPASLPERPDKKLPCVIYCHGNSGCRVDANDAAVMLLPDNITLFTLDFAGSGASGGEYVSLGYYEMQDLATAVDHLRIEGQTSVIGLWGRSMGAVTALLYGATDPSIAGMVLDSPFGSLTQLIMELTDDFKIPLPKFGVKMAVQYMRRLIKQRALFDIQDLDSLSVAPQSFIPLLAGHAEGDVFIRPHHSEEIYKAYAGDKNLIKFPGDHNSARPSFYYDSVSIFFHNVLHPPEPPSPVPFVNDELEEEAEGEEATDAERLHSLGNGWEAPRMLQPTCEEDNGMAGVDLAWQELGIDPSLEGLDQATLYEMLGLSVPQPSSSTPGGRTDSEQRGEAGGAHGIDSSSSLERLNSSLGRGRLFPSDPQPPREWNQQAQQGSSKDEEPRRASGGLDDEENSRRAAAASTAPPLQRSPSSDLRFMPASEQDEEEMLMAAIALSLRDVPDPSQQQAGNSSSDTNATDSAILPQASGQSVNSGPLDDDLISFREVDEEQGLQPPSSHRPPPKIDGDLSLL